MIDFDRGKLKIKTPLGSFVAIKTANRKHRIIMPSASSIISREMPESKNFKNLTGQKFHRLRVIGFVGMNSHKSATWECKCDCGNVVNMVGDAIKRGHTKSCGCATVELIIERVTKHGGIRTEAYKSWIKMNARCHNSGSTSYRNYGARGINVCDRWANFGNFINDMGERPPGHSLDRIDNSKGYSPENCRWATRKEQNRNKRGNRMITYKGETLPLVVWAERFEIKYVTLVRRLVLGWTVNEALETPINIKFRNH